MNTDPDKRSENDDEEWGDVGDFYIVPTAKVRLPEDVTKLRKRHRKHERREV